MPGDDDVLLVVEGCRLVVACVHFHLVNQTVRPQHRQSCQRRVLLEDTQKEIETSDIQTHTSPEQQVRTRSPPWS